MPSRSASARLRRLMAALTDGPQILAFLPAATLAAYWLGGEAALLLVAVLLPAVVSACGLYARTAGAPTRSAPLSLPSRSAATARLETLLADAEVPVALLTIGLDDADDLRARLGPGGLAEVAEATGARLASTVRASDLVARTGEAAFVVVLSAPRGHDIATLLGIAERLKEAVAEPILLGGSRLYVTGSVGIARARAGGAAGAEALLAAGEQALAEAAAQGPGSVRAHDGTRPRPAAAQAADGTAIAEALAAGQIGPWFQPQVRADTGELTGAEALVRWTHPVRGVLPPSAFLAEAEAAGLSERLGATVLHRSLTALRSWDLAGVRVPHVAVNFATAELRDPGLLERVRWELDRADLAPGRLTVEILETVIAGTDDDVVTRNLAGLAKLGCGIDLDDFGTGHAAIGSIRRFSVQRVKIDRSFVARLDTDADQQAVVSAMILMADRLGLDTLAEGVETAAEHAALARLGCRHVQGYALARPMPERAFLEWVAAREAGLPALRAATHQPASRPGAGAAQGPGKTA